MFWAVYSYLIGTVSVLHCNHLVATQVRQYNNAMLISVTQTKILRKFLQGPALSGLSARRLGMEKGIYVWMPFNGNTDARSNDNANQLRSETTGGQAR